MDDVVLSEISIILGMRRSRMNRINRLAKSDVDSAIAAGVDGDEATYQGEGVLGEQHFGC